MQDPNDPAYAASTPVFFTPDATHGDAGHPANTSGDDLASPVGASTLVGQAKDQLVGRVESGKDRLADTIDALAGSVRGTGEQFAGKQDWIARAIDGGAQELKALADGLRGKDVAGLFAQAQTFARTQPAVFIGASLAAGFALARLGKVLAADLSRDDLPTMPEVGHGR